MNTPIFFSAYIIFGAVISFNYSSSSMWSVKVRKIPAFREGQCKVHDSVKLCRLKYSVSFVLNVTNFCRDKMGQNKSLSFYFVIKKMHFSWKQYPPSSKSSCDRYPFLRGRRVKFLVSHLCHDNICKDFYIEEDNPADCIAQMSHFNEEFNQCFILELTIHFISQNFGQFFSTWQ